MLDELTRWSPAPTMLKTEKKIADIPEPVSMAAVPPSSAAMRAATASFVGFCRRE